MIVQHAGTGRARLCVVAAHAAVRGPPPDYNHRVLRKSSEAVIRNHPSLLPLVQDGAAAPPPPGLCLLLPRPYHAHPIYLTDTTDTLCRDAGGAGAPSKL